MSILIKGMEMPKEGCKDCLLVKRGQVFDICPFLKREVNGNVERGGKPYDCPLVPVPPHGRLIDADAALRDGWTINRTYPASPTEMVYEVKAIDCLPTVIPAEEGER